MATLAATSSGAPAANGRPAKYPTCYRTIAIDGVSIFYREAGPKDGPTILLLHGLPSSSRMFESLFDRLTDRYHLVAPDYPRIWPQRLAKSQGIHLHVRSPCRDHGPVH